MSAKERPIVGLSWILFFTMVVLLLVTSFVKSSIASDPPRLTSSITTHEIVLSSGTQSTKIYYWPAAFVFAVFSILSLITFARTSRLIMAILAMIFTAITYALTKLAGG